MGKIFYICGKSSSGKDSIYQALIQDTSLGLKPVTLYTTRPIRKSEREGVEYHFIDEKEALSLIEENKVIEYRKYATIYGDWYYLTVADGQINLQNNYLMIGTLESYEKTVQYFGAEYMIPLYIDVEDGERLLRAIAREKEQEKPSYAEMCRRFLADEKDFAAEKLQHAGIEKHFINNDFNRCLNEIKNTIILNKK